jgi:hypothetical protein
MGKINDNKAAPSVDVPRLVQLLPCPFCGGAVKLEEAERTRDRMMGERRWWGVVCRNTTNLGGTCAIQQIPSASEDAAISRWNMRNGKLYADVEARRP